MLGGGGGDELIMRSTISAGCVPVTVDKMHQYVHVRQIFPMSDEISGSSDNLPGYHVVLIVSLAYVWGPCTLT